MRLGPWGRRSVVFLLLILVVELFGDEDDPFLANLENILFEDFPVVLGKEKVLRLLEMPLKVNVTFQGRLFGQCAIDLTALPATLTVSDVEAFVSDLFVRPQSQVEL